MTTQKLPNNTVISIQDLSKYYRLGLIGGGTVREDINRLWARLRRRPDPLLKIGERGHGNRKGGQIWALDGVNLEIEEGEILGIIGRNGAGKSTLLKILSRITAPTSGCAKIDGRVGCLLEVGTGFHPELTGRENIFLNGAILGMSRSEVRNKFDEIVEFAEMQKFVDTPVKRYSSGMTVRLAFAVAAHLEPEILIIDEVLAVGDVEFQKKCLGKMQGFAETGRTVLFVSHNLQSIQSLCKRCVVIDKGLVVFDGKPDDACAHYLSGLGKGREVKVWKKDDAPGNAWFSLLSIRAIQEESLADYSSFSSGKDIYIEIEIDLLEVRSKLCVGFDLISSDGGVVFRSYQTDMPEIRHVVLELGINILRCKIPAGTLNDGVFFVAPKAGVHLQEWIVLQPPVIEINVALDHQGSWFWNGLNKRTKPGVVAPVLNWERV